METELKGISAVVVEERTEQSFFKYFHIGWIIEKVIYVEIWSF